nr:ATP-binding cassette domain-containing protein [Lachnospiraceae bacterium]
EEKRIEEGLSLQHVSFQYPTTKDREGGYVLTDVSFTCPVGLNALVGESGSGKSTIVKLLCKELPLESGTITWMGRDYREIKTSQLRKEITQVDYHSYLFTGTIRENLLMGKQDATEEELWKVLSEVSMDEVVKNHGGLDGKVWERGANFSGGQRQRLAIARALLHDTKVMIFDEATSNIDVESESIILSLIHRLSKHKVILLISHRLANVVDANQILVLDHGLCVEHGTHEELMKEQGVYANLSRTQKELEEVGGEVS